MNLSKFNRARSIWFYWPYNGTNYIYLFDQINECRLYPDMDPNVNQILIGGSCLLNTEVPSHNFFENVWWIFFWLLSSRQIMWLLAELASSTGWLSRTTTNRCRKISSPRDDSSLWGPLKAKSCFVSNSLQKWRSFRWKRKSLIMFPPAILAIGQQILQCKRGVAFLSVDEAAHYNCVKRWESFVIRYS